MFGRWRRHAAGLLIGLALGVLILLARSSGALQRFENVAAEACMRLLRHPVASDILIVGIDEQSLTELSSWPWPRRYHARVLDTLLRAQPRSIFVDVDFSSSAVDPADDAALEAALAARGDVPVVLPEFFQPLTKGNGQDQVTEPLGRFTGHVILGSVNLQPDADGLVRRLPLTWKLNGVTQPAAVARLAANTTAARAGETLLIDYAISPESFSFVSYADVLAGRIPGDAFKGHTVLIGATALELHDLVSVPIDRDLPGVVVQALALQTLRSGPPRIPPNRLYIAALMAWTMLLLALFHVQSWRRNVAALAVGVVVLAVMQVYAYAEHRVALEVVPPALALLATFIVATLRSLDEQTLRALAYAVGIRRRDALLRGIVESSTDTILCVDARGRIRTANPAASRLFGVAAPDLRGSTLGQYFPALEGISPDTLAARLEGVCGTLSEFQARTAAAAQLPVEVSFGRAGIPGEALYTAIVRDISERKAQQRELEYRATHDALTKLPNRAALDSRLADLGNGTRAALLMLDLSRFKDVNDTLGHGVGDAVLQEVAARFVATTGERGLVARIGGDEFAVLALASPEEGAVVLLAEDIAQSLKVPIDLGGMLIDVGVSTGIAFYPADAVDGAALLRHADVAMYLAKRRGSPYERYDAAHDGHTLRKLTMVSELRSAIARGGLDLHYQPQVDLGRGSVHAVEALARWEHPTLGKVSPAEFVAIAESTDLIGPLTEFTLREALAQSSRWRGAGLELRVAVNLSARMLHDAGVPRRLAHLLAASGLPPTALEVEITESAVMLDPARALRVVGEIHDLGVLVTIDDYGTGFSALNYLRDLPVHTLKLDKSFIQGMHRRRGDRVIVESTIAMAHALGLQVVAEGVEAEADARLLTELSCDLAQGYYFSRPLKADDCATWVHRINAVAAGRSSAAGDAGGAAYAATG